MNENPYTSAYLKLWRASELLGRREKTEKTDSWLTNRKSKITPSIRTLRRPLKGKESGADRSDPLTHVILEALKFALEHGDEKMKEAAVKLTYDLIGRAMMVRLLDTRRGSIPRFVNRIEKSVESFEEKVH